MDLHGAEETADGGVAHIRASLEAMMCRLWGTDVDIEDLNAVTTGASRQTWTFQARSDDGRRVASLVLRKDPEGLVRPEMMAREAGVLRDAARHGIPVPQVLASGHGDEELGVPYIIMEFVEGEVVPRRILRRPELQAAHDRIVEQCGTILARIHDMHSEAVPDLPYDNLGRLREELDRYGTAHPVFELAFRWLERNRPTATRRTVVHGDFRNGNLIVGPEGIRAVLDWEVVHRGDPMEDLGWLCVRAWRYGSAQPVGGFGSREALFSSYEKESGQAVDPEVVRWWEVVATLKWGINCLELFHRHHSGAVPSLELAVIGRRTSENEFDLLEMLCREEPGPVAPI